jgi:capsular exopolysaccharide synthesis family protein
MNPSRYLFILIRRWWWLLLLAPLAVGVITYWVKAREPVVYEATARLLIGPGIDSPNPGTGEFKAGGQLMHTYAQVVTTRPILQSISDKFGLELSPERLQSKIEVKPNDEAQILAIRAQDRDPVRAVIIANALADEVVRLSPAGSGGSTTQVREEMRAQVPKLQADIETTEARIKQLEADYQAAVAASQTPVSAAALQKINEIKAGLDQLEVDLQNTTDLPAQRLILDKIAFERSRLAELQSTDTLTQPTRDILGQLTQERTRLSDANRSLALLYTSLDTTVTNQVKLLEAAVAGTPVNSQTQLEVLMSALAGLLIALAIAVASEYFDDTIRTNEDLAQTTGIPVLGTLVNHEALPDVGDHGRLVVQALPTSQATENYRLLSTKFLLGKADTQKPQSVLVTGLHANDNTGEIAANLAVTLALAGSRVALVEANLRDPQIGPLFGITDPHGLADLLTDQSELSEGVTFSWRPGLSIIPGSALPSNAFELLASPRLVTLLQELKQRVDIVIIAAAPLLACAESLVLASRVDAVLLVARSSKTSRKEVGKAIESLQLLGVHILGFVVKPDREGVRPAASQTENLRRTGRWPVDLFKTVRHISRHTAGPLAQAVMPVPMVDASQNDHGMTSG